MRPHQQVQKNPQAQPLRMVGGSAAGSNWNAPMQAQALYIGYGTLARSQNCSHTVRDKRV
jgi:hypothetical protein